MLTIDGEVDTVAVKRRLLSRAAGSPGVTGVVDRLRVKPARPSGDGDLPLTGVVPKDAERD